MTVFANTYLLAVDVWCWLLRILLGLCDCAISSNVFSKHLRRTLFAFYFIGRQTDIYPVICRIAAAGKNWRKWEVRHMQKLS